MALIEASEGVLDLRAWFPTMDMANTCRKNENVPSLTKWMNFFLKD